MAVLTFKQTAVRLMQNPLLWTWIVLSGFIPTSGLGGATGFHYDTGIPLTAFYVKHGTMGIGGGTLAQGWVFIPDGSPRPASGARVGWFLRPVLIGMGLNGCFWFAVSCTGVWLWCKVRRRSNVKVV
jgi:hypothetical protein